MKSFVKEYLTKLGEADRLPEKQFNSMFASLDENNDGEISKDEMKEFIEKIRATEVSDIYNAVADAIHQEEIKDLIDEIWATYDKDNSGQLSKAEMKQFVKEYLTKIGEGDRLPEKQFNSIFSSLDENSDGQISKAEMREFIEKVKATAVEDVKEAVAEMIQQEEVKELIDDIWALYDKDNSGQLSKAEMKPFVKEYLNKLGEGDRLPEEQFNSMFASMDENNDGQVSKAEIKEFIEKIRATEVIAMKKAVEEAVAEE
jgi:Ca2+-binding EF-hand superfamily protein